jgi:hypothetical protein
MSPATRNISFSVDMAGRDFASCKFAGSKRARQRGGQGGVLLRANLREAKASEEAAKLVNVSPRSAEYADKVLEQGTEELTFVQIYTKVQAAAQQTTGEVLPKGANRHTLDRQIAYLMVCNLFQDMRLTQQMRPQFFRWFSTQVEPRSLCPFPLIVKKINRKVWILRGARVLSFVLRLRGWVITSFSYVIQVENAVDLWNAYEFHSYFSLFHRLILSRVQTRARVVVELA